MDTDENWIVARDVQDGDPFTDQYSTAFYWAFMTMTTVGYGEVVPRSSPEKIYSILSMIIACGFFSFILGSIGTYLHRGDASLQMMKDEGKRINYYMTHHEFPKNFR
jgi:hypothetical protein